MQNICCYNKVTFLSQWGGQCWHILQELYTQFREYTGLKLYCRGRGERNQYVLQAFVQRPILRSERCLKSKCSTSLFSSPCFCCLFTFWQSQSLFCYSQLSQFISAYTFLWKWCSGFRGCFSGCYSASLSLPRSLLQYLFAMPFHPLPSYCWAPFELFKSRLEYCSIPFKRSTKPCLWFAGIVKEEREKVDQVDGTLVTRF